MSPEEAAHVSDSRKQVFLQVAHVQEQQIISVVFSYLVGYIQTFPRDEVRVGLLLGEAGSRQLELLFLYVTCHFGLIIALILQKLNPLTPPNNSKHYFFLR